MIKVTSKTLIVNFETEVKLGKNDAIELTLVHQAFIYEGKNGNIDCDLELADFTNIKFLGMPIEEGYKQFNQFKEQLLALGINLDKLVDEEIEKLTNNGLKSIIISMFRDRLK
jgi:hypothetical protein